MPSPDDLLNVNVIEQQVKAMLNDDLKDTLRNEGERVSGVKAVLQKRIVEYALALSRDNQSHALTRLRYRVENRGRSPPPASAAPPDAHRVPTPIFQPSPFASTNIKSRVMDWPPGWKPSFKASAFYRAKQDLAPPQTLYETPKNKTTVMINFMLPDDLCTRMKSDSSLRVMLYCAEVTAESEEASEIVFPAQIEVKVNNMEVKSNYRGLKNKPGTTKPADLTEAVRKKSSYPNQVALTYALTLSRYVTVVKLVKKHSPSELAAEISRNRRIEEETVRREMISNAEDDDIVATSSLMTLKDEVSCTRISLPCRSTICKHNQCFDAETFLHLQDQAPQWKCPICNTKLSFSTLAIDGYFENILKNTPASVEQVIIEPNGEWRVKAAEATVISDDKPKKASYDKDSDEDLIQVTKQTTMRAPPVKAATPGGVAQFTPPDSSREASVTLRRSVSTAAPSLNGTSKRGNAVIDLTMSDDDEPPRPTKRPAFAPISSRQGSAFPVVPRPIPVPSIDHGPLPNSYFGRSNVMPGAHVPYARASITPAPRPAYADRVGSLPREQSGAPMGMSGGQRISQSPAEESLGMFDPYRNLRSDG